MEQLFNKIVSDGSAALGASVAAAVAVAESRK